MPSYHFVQAGKWLAERPLAALATDIHAVSLSAKLAKKDPAPASHGALTAMLKNRGYRHPDPASA